MELHQGKLPASFSGLRKLAGIGDYTAGAVASIAYGERVPAIDGNVVRVYSRILHETGETDRTPVKKRLEQAVRAELPAESFMPFWNQALMELGASICLPKVPKCTLCPWQNRCLAAKAGDAPSLPRKKPKKQRIQDKKTFYVTAAVHNGQWYIELEKQPENGLLASLYLFSAEKPDVVYESIPLQPAKHVFTHREWLMDGFLVISRYHEDMISLEALEKEKALPSAMRPFYQQMKQLLSLREDLLKEESRNTGIQADPAQN